MQKRENLNTEGVPFYFSVSDDREKNDKLLLFSYRDTTDDLQTK